MRHRRQAIRRVELPLRVLGAAAACAIALLAAHPASASATLPPQGLYEACYPGLDQSGCAARLQRMGGAGFRLVVNYWMLRESSAADVVSYVNSAHASGVQVIWSLNDWWAKDPAGTDIPAANRKLAADCGCTTNQQMVDYIVRLAKDLPGTWGYYLADEPDAARRDQVAAFAARVKELDPSHPRLIVACGVCNGDGDPTGSRAAPLAGLDAVLGTDLYPITTEAPDPARAGRYVATGTKGLQSVADRAGRDSAIVLQSFSWGFSSFDSHACGSSPSNCRFPTRGELAAQRDAALTNGRPRMILWYALFDVIGAIPEQRPSDWTPPPNPEERWNDLLAAAFAPEPPTPPPAEPAPPAAVVRPPRTLPKSVRFRSPIAGRRRVGHLQLTATFDHDSARLTLRSTRLRLRAGDRYLVRSCISSGSWRRCRSRALAPATRARALRTVAPRLSILVARPDPGAADALYTGQITVSVRNRTGRLVQFGASPRHLAAGMKQLSVQARQ
jgi:hypothetical protein